MGGAIVARRATGRLHGAGGDCRGAFVRGDGRGNGLGYEVLARLQPSPVIALNRAVAIAMAEGCEKGLELIADIQLPGYYLLPAARADLLRRLGRTAEAATAYAKR